jgi:hypothetical protein
MDEEYKRGQLKRMARAYMREKEREEEITRDF